MNQLPRELLPEILVGFSVIVDTSPPRIRDHEVFTIVKHRAALTYLDVASCSRLTAIPPIPSLRALLVNKNLASTIHLDVLRRSCPHLTYFYAPGLSTAALRTIATDPSYGLLREGTTIAAAQDPVIVAGPPTAGRDVLAQWLLVHTRHRGQEYQRARKPPPPCSILELQQRRERGESPLTTEDGPTISCACPVFADMSGHGQFVRALCLASAGSAAGAHPTVLLVVPAAPALLAHHAAVVRAELFAALAVGLPLVVAVECDDNCASRTSYECVLAQLDRWYRAYHAMRRSESAFSVGWPVAEPVACDEATATADAHVCGPWYRYFPYFVVPFVPTRRIDVAPDATAAPAACTDAVALLSENVCAPPRPRTDPDSLAAWYVGPTVRGALEATACEGESGSALAQSVKDGFPISTPAQWLRVRLEQEYGARRVGPSQRLRMPARHYVNCAYRIGGIGLRLVPVGPVYSGVLTPGMPLRLVPAGVACTANQFEVHHEAQERAGCSAVTGFTLEMPRTGAHGPHPAPPPALPQVARVLVIMSLLRPLAGMRIVLAAGARIPGLVQHVQRLSGRTCFPVSPMQPAAALLGRPLPVGSVVLAALALCGPLTVQLLDAADSETMDEIVAAAGNATTTTHATATATACASLAPAGPASAATSAVGDTAPARPSPPLVRLGTCTEIITETGVPECCGRLTEEVVARAEARCTGLTSVVTVLDEHGAVLARHAVIVQTSPVEGLPGEAFVA